MSGKPLVAVVDDDRRVLESIENLMESAGFLVMMFSSAEALLHSENLPRVACVVSDIAMPGMDGFELQQHLQQHRPGLPLIFITGHEINAAALVKAQGSQCLLRKPFEGSHLLAAVSRALAGGQP